MADTSLPSAQIGWPLLPLPDAGGSLSYPTLEDSVRQSVEIILRTIPGEQLMRPLFGAGLATFIAEPNNLTTRRRIFDLVSDSLTNWEPRILVDRVDVLEVIDYPSRLRIEISYRIRRTGASQNVGLSLDIGS